VGRELLEQFLEAAPVPLGIPASEVERRLGPAARTLEKDGHPIGFQYPDRGVWLAIEDGVVSSISFLTGGAESGGASFTGALPGGLCVADAPARLRELLGEPDRTQDVPLPRPPHARLVLAFYDLRATATLLVAVRSEAPGRIDRLVLSRRPGEDA
jgi:hypothetical protein